MSCSFFNIAGGICGADEWSSSSTSIILFTKCDEEIQKHKKFLKFSGVQTEVELILARCRCFEKSSNFLEMTICPAHLVRLGISWRRPSGVPDVVSGHCKDFQKVPVSQKGMNLSQSMKLLDDTNQLLSVGLGKWWNVWWTSNSQLIATAPTFLYRSPYFISGSHCVCRNCVICLCFKK